MKLDGQVALIIGGARGIGETIAHTFSKEGATIVLVDLERMKTELDAVMSALPSPVYAGNVSASGNLGNLD